jgi:hypothetical protein
MAEDSASTTHHEARQMLDIFASIGARTFDVTWTMRAGDKESFRRGVSLTDLAPALPAMLDAATAGERNVIVRPHGPGVTFLQLDDLAGDKLPRLAPAVFLTLETSPGNFQAWLALAGREDKDLARRVRHGAGADMTASGATRVAGSVNFKDKYAPDYPRVAIREAWAGRVTSAAELERLGLVAPPEELPPLRVTPARRHFGSHRTWPSYARCLDGAPLNSEGDGPDTSRADIVWCMTAITWGFGIEETAARLIEEPESKAHERGQDYAEKTARKAALYVQQRKNQPRHRMAR